MRADEARKISAGNRADDPEHTARLVAAVYACFVKAIQAVAAKGGTRVFESEVDRLRTPVPPEVFNEVRGRLARDGFGLGLRSTGVGAQKSRTIEWG